MLESMTQTCDDLITQGTSTEPIRSISAYISKAFHKKRNQKSRPEDRKIELSLAFKVTSITDTQMSQTYSKTPETHRATVKNKSPKTIFRFNRHLNSKVPFNKTFNQSRNKFSLREEYTKRISIPKLAFKKDNNECIHVNSVLSRYNKRKYDIKKHLRRVN